MNCDSCSYDGPFILLSVGVPGEIPDKWQCPECGERKEMRF